MRQIIVTFTLLAACIAEIAVAEEINDWHTQCDPDCRTYTFKEVYKWEDGEPFVVHLEVNSKKQLKVSALISRQEYEKYYTLDPPTEWRHKGKQYVGARQFFGNAPAMVSVDGEQIQHVWHKDGGHMAGDLQAGTLDTLHGGRKAVVSGDFCAAPSCAKQSVTFSLSGFSEAYAARTPGAASDTNSTNATARDPVAFVSRDIAGNRYGIKEKHLKTKNNPFGQGTFVYIPEVNIDDYDRLFIWFVKGGEAIALNGPSISITRNAKRPLETGYEFWEGTGLSSKNVTKRGLDAVYPRR